MEAIIWSKPFCPFCDRAKQLMDMNGIQYEERDITKGWDIAELRKQVPSARTMPQIWIDGKYIKNGVSGEMTYVGEYDTLAKIFVKP
jgi:glutaredoxin 3